MSPTCFVYFLKMESSHCIQEKCYFDAVDEYIVTMFLHHVFSSSLPARVSVNFKRHVFIFIWGYLKSTVTGMGAELSSLAR